MEVALPEIDEHAFPRLCRVPPQFPRFEADAVERLWAAPAPVSMGVRQDEDAVEGVDAPAMPARVARQPRVAGRLPVARDDAIARLEARRGVRLALLGPALAH